jgi:C-terminal processing protease CtpA/Prc
MKADSDHHPFFDAKFPVIMLHTGLHDNYHRPSDDIQTLNIEGIERVSKLLFEITVKLADELPIGSFRDASRRETPDMRTTKERSLPPLPGRLGVRWKDAAATEQGLEVNEVAARSPAELAGLKIGDRMLALDGNPITGSEPFRHLVLAAPANVTMKVQRAGADEALELPLKLSGEPMRWGITWREDDAEPGMLFLLRVVDGSPAAQAGVKVGDRIISVNGQTFANQNEFEKLVTADEVILQLEFEGKYRNASVKALKFPSASE